MPRSVKSLSVTPFVVAAVAAAVAAHAGCDLVRDDGDQRLSRERGGDPPRGPVNPGAEPPLIAAARAGDAGEVRRLVRDGADVNAFGNGRQTALIAAAAGGHRDVVAALVEAGADANLRDAKGDTAAEAAASRGHDRIAESLRKAEVKPPAGPAKPVPAPKPQPDRPRQ
jgi:ankyrin repeat protein